MAFNTSATWTGWEFSGARAKGFVSVTTKGGDGTQSSSDQPGTAWIEGVAVADSLGHGQNFFVTPIGEGVPTVTSLSRYFSDDFGGAALNTTTTWDVIDGGLPAITSGVPVAVLASDPTPNFTQAAIGTGITGITHAVTASTLVITFPTTANSEKWFLSQSMFSGSEDIMVILSKSAANTTNSFWVGLVEVDPSTGIPLLNPNVANEFTNKAGMEFAKTATITFANLESIADSSPAVATTTSTTFPPAAMTTPFETFIQIRAEDIHAHSALVDNPSAKTVSTQRLSSQVPNDRKVYKLLMRARNIGAATATTITVSRILVQDHQPLNVSVTDGAGAQIGSQGVAVNVVASSVLPITVTGYTDSITALGASATFTGTTRAVNTLAQAYCYFNATAWADQAGTLNIQNTQDSGTTWQTIATVAVAANSAGSLSTRITGVTNSSSNDYRVQYVNGGTAQGTFRINSSFSVN